MNRLLHVLAFLVGIVIQTVAVIILVGCSLPGYAPPSDWPQNPNTWKTYQPWRGTSYVIR